jgi:hypothetical protein
MITLTDGSQIEYHTSFTFPQHVYPKLTLYLSPEFLMIDYGELRTNMEDFPEIHCDADEPHRIACQFLVDEM